MQFTMFHSVFDREKVDSEKSWADIVVRALAPREYPRKDAMPLIKLALFGLARSTRGFLRHEHNILEITGLEADYDAGRLHPVDVITALAMASITALVYTTPSHAATAPRWRILAPLSRAYPVEDRARFLARINGVIEGALADESFVPAQTYYWGRVAGVEYSAHESRGEFVDLLPGLDAGARWPVARAVAVPVGVPPDGAAFAQGGRNRALFTLASGLRRRNLSPAAIEAALLAENDARCVPPLPVAEVQTIARSAAHYTPAVDYAPLAEPAPEPERVLRVERVPTGQLIPHSVVAADEIRLDSLREVLGERNGAYPNSLYNATSVVRATLNGRLWVDQSNRLPMNGPHLLTEVDAYEVTERIGALSGGQNIRDNTVFKAMILLAHSNPIDPWQDWLNSLVWDGTERLNSMAEDYFGVRVGDDELERLIFRKLMIGVVARQFNPGAKFDLMVVLEGAQGARKSTSLRALFGNPYVASWEHDFNTKDFRQQLQGNVCIEVAELASFARSDLNSIKSILSETVDVYRPSYGRTVERRPRRCVMVGTSNDDSYLTDVEGNRRFVPVKCGMIDVEGLEDAREQLFAEAVVAFRRGGADARWWELPGRVVSEQADRMVEDPWMPRLQNFLVGQAEVRISDLLVTPLIVPIERQTTGAARRAAGLLRQMGWRKQHRMDGNWWVRGE